MIFLLVGFACAFVDDMVGLGTARPLFSWKDGGEVAVGIVLMV